MPQVNDFSWLVFSMKFLILFSIFSISIHYIFSFNFNFGNSMKKFNFILMI